MILSRQWNFVYPAGQRRLAFILGFASGIACVKDNLGTQTHTPNECDRDVLTVKVWRGFARWLLATTAHPAVTHFTDKNR
jgi:hypothetical protein